MAVVDCGMLETPVNGQIRYSDGATYGSNATYLCNEGFMLAVDINAIRTCQRSGSWSASAFTCQSNTVR